MTIILGIFYTIFSILISVGFRVIGVFLATMGAHYFFKTDEYTMMILSLSVVMAYGSTQTNLVYSHFCDTYGKFIDSIGLTLALMAFLRLVIFHTSLPYILFPQNYIFRQHAFATTRKENFYIQQDDSTCCFIEVVEEILLFASDKLNKKRQLGVYPLAVLLFFQSSDKASTMATSATVMITSIKKSHIDIHPLMLFVQNAFGNSYIMAIHNISVNTC